MSEFWLREIKVNTAGKEFKYPDFHIEFRIEFDDTDDPDMAIISIFNLKPETENRIKKGQVLVLSAGYEGDIGTVLAGEISEVFSYTEGQDRICEVEVIDATERFLTTRISKTYKAGIKASQVLADILAVSGLEIGRISLPDDVAYTNGRTVDGRLREIAKEIARDGGASLYINNGAIFAVPAEFSQDIGVLLNKDTGLLHSPSRIDSDDGREWDVPSLLNYRIRAGSRVQVGSKTANGVYRVVKGRHTATQAEFMTRIEVTEA